MYARSEALGANESIGEVNGQKHGHGTAENIVERHGSFSVRDCRTLSCTQSIAQKTKH